MNKCSQRGSLSKALVASGFALLTVLTAARFWPTGDSPEAAPFNETDFVTEVSQTTPNSDAFSESTQTRRAALPSQAADTSGAAFDELFEPDSASHNPAASMAPGQPRSLRLVAAPNADGDLPDDRQHHRHNFQNNTAGSASAAENSDGDAPELFSTAPSGSDVASDASPLSLPDSAPTETHSVPDVPAFLSENNRGSQQQPAPAAADDVNGSFDLRLPDVVPSSTGDATPERFDPPAGSHLAPSVDLPDDTNATTNHSDQQQPDAPELPNQTSGTADPGHDIAGLAPNSNGPDGLQLWWEPIITDQLFSNRTPIRMSLSESLRMALTEAPELQILHSDWYIRQTESERLAAAFDWTTFVDAIWNRDSTPVGSDLDGSARRLRRRSSSANAGLRRLNRDGSEFEIAQNFGTLNSNSRFINPNNQGTARLSLDYQKPLLRGAGEDIATSAQQLAMIDTGTAFDQFRIGVQDHLLNVASTYWSLVLQRGQFVQNVRSWERAKAIAAEMERRIHVDVTPGMLHRAHAAVAQRLSDAIEAEHDIIRTQDALLRLIYGARFTDYADNEIVTTSLPMRKTQPVPVAPQLEQAVRERSEIHLAIREIKAAAVRYNVAENQVKPALNMVLTGYVAGLRGNNDIGGAFLNQFSEGEPGVGIGFNYEIPYRNRAALAQREQGQIALKRMQVRLQQVIGEVTEDVRNQIIQRNKYGIVLDQQAEALRRANAILKYTEKRRELLADGVDVADLYLANLLQMQARVTGAEYSYLQAQVRYTLADNALLRALARLDGIAHQQTQARDAAGCQNCDVVTDAQPALPPADEPNQMATIRSDQSPARTTTSAGFGHSVLPAASLQEDTPAALPATTASPGYDLSIN